MSTPRDEWISNRAYALWEQNGRNHGQDQDHWDQATREWDELERVALPGHIFNQQTTPEPGPDAPAADMPKADHGIAPDQLQADVEMDPAPRFGAAPSPNRQSATGAEILGASQENKGKRKATGSMKERSLDSKGQAAI
jgi:hypothetical protein